MVKIAHYKLGPWICQGRGPIYVVANMQGYCLYVLIT